ncbi:MAG: helix-turn-helix domain-containing protein [Selenomonas sp.]
MQLGDWIKSYRKAQGLSMQRFADLCGFSKAYIGQLEKGINPKTGKKISPTMQTFTKIANSVGMSVDQLLEKLDDNQPVSIPSSPVPSSDPSSSLTADDIGHPLTPAERHHLSLYRSLDDKDRATVDDMTAMYADRARDDEVRSFGSTTSESKQA